METVKKITVRDINAMLPEKDKRAKAQAICAIRGFAYDSANVTTDVGTHVRFLGSFELLNAKGEAIKQSSSITFPGVVYDETEQAFADAKAKDETALVNFAVVIGMDDAGKIVGEVLAADVGATSPLDTVRAETADAISKALGIVPEKAKAA